MEQEDQITPEALEEPEVQEPTEAEAVAAVAGLPEAEMAEMAEMVRNGQPLDQAAVLAVQVGIT